MKWSLSLLVFEFQIGAVSSEETCDERAALLVLALSTQTHEETTDVLDILELSQLRQRVVTKGLVKRRVAVLVGDVYVSTLAYE